MMDCNPLLENWQRIQGTDSMLKCAKHGNRFIVRILCPARENIEAELIDHITDLHNATLAVNPENPQAVVGGLVRLVKSVRAAGDADFSDRYKLDRRVCDVFDALAALEAKP